MKRADLLHTIMTRVKKAAAHEGIDCELWGADLAAPGEFVLTAWGTRTAVVRLAEVLGRDDSLRDPKVVEDVGATDVGRRYRHIAVAAPDVW